MPRPTLAAALLISLASCQAEKNDPAGTASPNASAEQPLPRANPENLPDGAPVVNRSEPPTIACGADKLGRWLNLLPTSTVREAIADEVGERPIRYIEPGDVVTQDMRPDRLNIETGVDGRIKRFRCG